MKKVVIFFRNRAINAFTKKRKVCVLPDVSRCPSVAVLIDEGELPNSIYLYEEIRRLFATGNCTIYVVNTLMENKKNYDNIRFITKKSFGFFGLLKASDIASLSSVHYDMLLNLTTDEESLLADDYVMTVFDASFRVSFGKSLGKLYDLVLDTKKESIVDKVSVLCKYMTMLTGRR